MWYNLAGPDLTPNDHVHAEFHKIVRRDLASQIGLHADLSLRPRGAKAKALKTKGGQAQGTLPEDHHPKV